MVKPARDFQVRRKSKDGRTAACRECLHKRDAARWPKEKDKRQKAMKEYYRTPTGKENVLAAKRRWLKKPENAVKRACHVIAGSALKSGLLTAQPCEVCGAEKTQAHHDDYSKPLDVRWLCSAHHARLHRMKLTG